MLLPETLVGALGGRKALNVVGKGIETHRPMGEGDVPVFILPGNRVLEPVLVIPILVVLARVSAP